MARKNSVNTKNNRPTNSTLRVKNPGKTPAGGYLEKIDTEIQSNQSKVSLVLGALIILVIGILIFNYFNRNKASLGPAQQADQTEKQGDVTPDQLPGKYTIKEGDTLFTIAEKYYQDGFKFTEIAKTNNLTNPDIIEPGQSLEIPKLDALQAQASPQASETAQANPSESAASGQTQTSLGTGGGNSTIWGDKIEGNSYTVVEGDWLSKIAGRAYGDVLAYEKIAKANNIVNPDQIEPGTALVIPR